MKCKLYGCWLIKHSIYLVIPNVGIVQLFIIYDRKNLKKKVYFSESLKYYILKMVSL